MLAYSYFMASYAPGGLGWHDYHSSRIFNSVEYLRLNGYLATYGFSIWSSCSDCSFDRDNWAGQIYLSGSALISLWPYVIVNHFLGREALFFVGPIIDKIVIFITAVTVTELLIRFVSVTHTSKESRSRHEGSLPIPAWWVGLSTFTLFTTSIWAYQMQRAMWTEIWFLLFLALSVVALLKNRFWIGCILVLIAGSMAYISGFILAFVLLVFSIFSRAYQERSVFVAFLPSALHQYRCLCVYSLYALAPAFINLGLRAIYGFSFGRVGQGSSLLFRIGISGDDAHNGGLVGALQFLGGMRITQCVSMLGTDGLQGSSLASKISAFNCSLTILGMLMLSSLSVIGVVWLLKTKPYTRLLLFPVSMILLITIAVFQQSFSAHLHGHSYPFALLFACGLVGLFLKGAEVIQSRSLSLIVFTPIVVACVLLSIRLSMLSTTPIT